MNQGPYLEGGRATNDLAKGELRENSRNEAHKCVIRSKPSRFVEFSLKARVGALEIPHIVLAKEEGSHLMKP